MANAIPHRCNFTGCRELITGGPYCAEHKARSSRERTRRGDRVYNATEDRFRASVFSQNSFCQRVLADGTRCRYPALILHHLIEFRDRPDLKLDARNVVMTCAIHHPRPSDQDQGEYVPTVFTLLGEVLEPEHGVMPGWSVPRGLRLWSRAERKRFFESLVEA